MSTSTITTAGLDVEAITARQQRVWSSGDFHAVAARITLVAELLCDAADLRAGWRVLDVAAGSGNATLAAARLGCEAVGIDYVPELLERGRARAAAEALEIELLEGDAQALPFDEASFDAVVSVFGVMFAPDQERAAGELVRVCRPGGTIALASWTPEGFVADMLRTVSARVPPPPGLKPPILWGSQERLAELLGDAVESLDTRRRTFTFRFLSPDHFVDFFRRYYGPTHAAFAALDEAGQAELAVELAALAARYDRLDGAPVAIEADYLEAVAVRR